MTDARAESWEWTQPGWIVVMFCERGFLRRCQLSIQ